ncbi:hypothetical protein Tco_0821812 [Tanacetum coccineum]|uniref:Uncharacterized protein n=1 Tax=Tanacetum coccineum TaxID=301880 RepID=A0ABQ5AHG3_9ASTR
MKKELNPLRNEMVKEVDKEERKVLRKRKLSTSKKIKTRKQYSGQNTSEDDRLVIHMLVEKKYPLRKKVLLQMLELKLESEEDSTMALELIRFVKKLVAELEPEDSNGDEEDL